MPGEARANLVFQQNVPQVQIKNNTKINIASERCLVATEEKHYRRIETFLEFCDVQKIYAQTMTVLLLLVFTGSGFNNSF